MQAWDRFLNWWAEGSIPVTKFLIACCAATFLTFWCGGASLVMALMFAAPSSLAQPWRLLTYAIVETNIIGLLFNGLFLAFLGSSLERSWGSRTYAIFAVTMSLAVALSMSLAAVVLHLPLFVSGSLVGSAFLAAFCLMNPDEIINLYGILPIRTRWILWAEIAILFFNYGYGNPILGVFALSGIGAAWLWLRVLPWSDAFMPPTARFSPKFPTRPGKRTRRDDDFSIRDLNPFERMARARRKKQFERLFEDDPPSSPDKP